MDRKEIEALRNRLRDKMRALKLLNSEEMMVLLNAEMLLVLLEMQESVSRIEIQAATKL